jgi:hypothetical protein
MLTVYCISFGEVKIRRLVVRGQPGQKVHKTLSQLMTEHSGAHLSSQLHQEAHVGGLQSTWVKYEDLVSKSNQHKKSW